MMKWYEDYEYASDLYDAVQKHQQSFKNHRVHLNKNGLFEDHSIDFIFPKTFSTGKTFETWSHKIYLRNPNNG